MAEISSLLTLQGQLALLTLIGFFLARKGIINAQGRKCLTDLLINVILPANIIQSFLVEFSWDVLKSSASILVISLALQIGCVVLCALGYNWLPFARRSVYQYGTVCSNGAFLGSALVDGIWGSSGLLLSSIYLIPQRVAMWSVGVSYFLQDEKPASKEEMRADRRAVLRKTFTHPCILAVMVGMVLMASQLPLPGFLGRTVKSLSKLQHGCFHDPDWCHHRQQPDGQTLGQGLLPLLPHPAGAYPGGGAAGLQALRRGEPCDRCFRGIGCYAHGRRDCRSGGKVRRGFRLCQQVRCGLHSALPHHHTAVVHGRVRVGPTATPAAECEKHLVNGNHGRRITVLFVQSANSLCRRMVIQ